MPPPAGGLVPPARLPGWARLALSALAAAACVYALAAADLMLRARSACREGELRMLWHRRPGLRKAHFDKAFEEEKARIEAQLASGALGAAEARERVAVARFAADEAAADSSLKEAVHWFQTAAELFAPPESRWTRRARERLAEARRMWKAELDGRKVPYRDEMLE